MVAVPVLPDRVRWLAVATVATGLFVLSVFATPPPEPIIPSLDLLPLDKWRHLLGYATLAVTLAYATADWETRSLVLFVGVVGVAALYGIGIEVVQATVPHRLFSVADAWANVLGALLVAPWFAVRSRVEFVRVP